MTTKSDALRDSIPLPKRWTQLFQSSQVCGGNGFFACRRRVVRNNAVADVMDTGISIVHAGAWSSWVFCRVQQLVARLQRDPLWVVSHGGPWRHAVMTI
jgi:hypothetical protein